MAIAPIGELRVGDLVIGSNGRPTPVLGVYPQGRKEVFRVRAQDGAETLCCAEHLWHVFTAVRPPSWKARAGPADPGDDGSTCGPPTSIDSSCRY